MEQAEIKAREIYERFYPLATSYSANRSNQHENTKQCSLICVENEYHSLREQLFNLRSCKVIENEKTYLIRLQQLIDEENEIKQHLNNL